MEHTPGNLPGFAESPTLPTSSTTSGAPARPDTGKPSCLIWFGGQREHGCTAAPASPRTAHKTSVAARLSPVPARTDEPAGRGSQSSHIGSTPRANERTSKSQGPDSAARSPHPPHRADRALRHLPSSLALLGQAQGKEVLIGSAMTFGDEVGRAAVLEVPPSINASATMASEA
jgi:hypothetical protein